MEQERTEGTTRFLTDSEERITKEMPVFYNPVMKRNRDLTLAVLLAMQKERTDLSKISSISSETSASSSPAGLQGAPHKASTHDGTSKAAGAPGARSDEQSEERAARQQDEKGIEKSQEFSVRERGAHEILTDKDKTPKRGLRIALPMEASGIRAARILHELVAPGHLDIDLLAINDRSERAIAYAKRNVKSAISGLDESRVAFSTLDASAFLRAGKGHDYIDIDPFGTPNPFLDAAVQHVNRGGLLAVTATDTSALAGTYPAATARKYWAVPTRTWVMHEAGLRILARKVQLIAAQYDKALVPALAIATDHYYRIFFRCLRSHTDVRDVLRQHEFLHVCTRCLQLAASSANTGACAGCGAPVAAAGPLWTGPLHDAQFVRAMRSGLPKLDAKTAKELDALLAIIEDECRLPVVGFLDVHELVSREKVQAPRTETVLERLGEHACRTHINGAAVKTDLPVAEVRRRLGPEFSGEKLKNSSH